MGYTAEEFSQVLNGGFTNPESGLICTMITRNDWQIKISSTESILHINIQPASPRLLGSLEIPVLLVTFKFTGFTTPQNKSLMDRFNRYFHKGGG
jgi:hypothetical protein